MTWLDTTDEFEDWGVKFTVKSYESGGRWACVSLLVGFTAPVFGML